MTHIDYLLPQTQNVLKHEKETNTFPFLFLSLAQEHKSGKHDFKQQGRFPEDTVAWDDAG